MTRGEFERIRQRMRGMGREARAIARQTDGATDSSDRFANSLTGLQKRLSQFQRTGTMARHEMDFMRRSMGLLGRDLRRAAADGELTEDQFRDLRNELERTRLDFDHLDNALRRHDAIAQRTARNRAERLRAEQQQRRDAARTAERLRREEERRQRDAQREAERLRRAEERRARERARILTAAAQQQARAEIRAQREAERVRMAALTRRRQQEAAQLRAMAQAHAAALRDEARRNRRADAERERAARQAAAAQRQSVARLAGLGGDDRGLTLRFRALGEGDMGRMTRGFSNLQRIMAGVTGSTDRTRRTVHALGGDLRTMAQALRSAQDAGAITRREFDALSNGLRLTVRDARQLRSVGDLTRSSFRDMRREVARLQAQLRLLGREGNVLKRLSDSILLLQRRMRDTRSSAGLVRRQLSRLGEGGLGGVRLLTRSLGALASGFGKVKDFVAGASRGMKIFLAVLALIGPLAAPVGALLTTILGGAFVALGAFALRGEKEVKSAFGRMKSTIGVTVRAAAQPLKASLIVAMSEVTVAVQQMGKALHAAFSATAPLVSNLAGAFTDLVARAMPGFVSSLQEMGPVINGFRDAMGMIGEGLGDMFAAMTAGGGAEGLAESWRIVGDGIRDVLVNIGEFINAMSQSTTATTLLKTAFSVLSGFLVVVEAAFAAVDAVLGPIIQKMDELGLTGGAIGILSTLFEAMGVSAGEVKTGLVDLKSAQDDAATSTLSHADALKTLNEQLRTYNSENLARFDAESALNKSFIDAKRNAENYGNTVKINNGIFDTTHENTQKVYEDFSKLAENTNRAVEAAEKAHQPFKEQNRLWKVGEENIRALGKAYGIPKEELDAFIKLVLKTPKQAKTEMQLEAEAAQKKAAEFLDKMNKADGFRAKAAAALEAGAALGKAANLNSLLNALNGRHTSSQHTAKFLTIRQSITQVVPSKHDRDGNGIPDMIQRPQANGGVLRNFANGGVESHNAQIAPAGAMRIWAERETGGESYIPLSPAKRARSRRIAEQTMGILGGRVEWFAKGGVRSEARQAIGPIKAATSGSTEKALLRLMNSIVKGTIKMAAALKQVTSALDKAKSKLSELRNSASSLSSSVKSGVLSAGDITSGVDPDKHVTVPALMGRLTASRDKATAFASALKRLRKRGLSKGLLKQVAEAGIGGGGLETAGALLTASGSELSSFNRLYSQISGAASSAGKTTADALFGKQIKVQEKLVKSLDELNRELKKATKKSAKKKATGGIIGAATGGSRGGMTLVGEEGPEFVRLPFGSSVYSNADSRRLAGGMGGGSGGVFVIPISIGERHLDTVILDSNRRTVRTHGGNVQATFGRKNG